jgi:hypothetical protein
MIQTSNTLATDYKIGSFGLNDSTMVAIVKAIAMTLVLTALWSLTHLFKGISGDAELYAVQALSRIRPGLAADLYLQNVSQDRFTVFSPIYAWFIRLLGLQQAALALTVACAAWFLIAAWALARELSSTSVAFLAVASLIIIKGHYGSYDIFGFSENWLTARSLAEALVVTAAACYFLGKKRIGFLICTGALLVHPIMALPGLLLLICLQVPIRIASMGAALGILAALAMAFVGSAELRPAGLLTIMDADWLEVVRERSQFLFLQYWTLEDWRVNARPFLYLTVSALVLDARMRKLCIAAMLVGAAGLAVAAIASLVAPVAILLQGQAWRWVWITSFTGILLLAPTAITMWRDERCGPICAILLVLGSTFTVIDSDACVALALGLWLVRPRIAKVHARYLRWAAGALLVVVAGWVLGNSWTIISSPSPETGRDPLIVAHLRNILGLGASAVAVAWLLVHSIRTSRSIIYLLIVSTTLAAGTAVALQGSLMQNNREGKASEIREFADWRSAIPPGSNVYVVPAYNSASFAWFTLERPSYLTVDQSAGVVYSRATALEVKRRSQVLLPMLGPDWQLLSKNLQQSKGQKVERMSSRPLTPESLVSVCTDSVLDFVVAKESLAFDPIRHRASGNWKDWNLYDCRHVRSLAPPA